MEISEFIFAGAMKTIIGLLIIVGAVVLQIFLSRSKRKWPGLILPVLTFIYSLIGVLSIASFKAASGASVAGLVIMVLLLMNIPTVILLAIYFVVKERNRKNKEIDKMNIKHL